MTSAGGLQLDGFNAEKKIGFEHQGYQHYEFPNHFHKTQREFDQQLARDHRKTNLCLAQGIKLIIIPDFPKRTSLLNLPEVVESEYQRLGISPKIHPSLVAIEPDRVFDRSQYEILSTIARSKGGRLLSQGYLGDRVALEWECRQGHQWLAMPNGVKSGTWCGACYGNIETTIEDVVTALDSIGWELIEATQGKEKKRVIVVKCDRGHQFSTSWKLIRRGNACSFCRSEDAPTIDTLRQHARSNGGRCLSSEFTRANDNYSWECAAQHQWQASYSSIKRGSWCRKCRMEETANKNRKITIEAIHAYARERGGECLSRELVDSRSPVVWRCAVGHEWATPPDPVLRRKSWCRACAAKTMGQRPLTLADMQSIAKMRGGKCLSDRYINGRQSLKWECQLGHIWTNSGGNISRGQWCPTCAGKKKLTLKDAQDHARRLGGVCLSLEYVNAGTKLDWKCAQAHQWSASFTSVRGTQNRRGTWCPVCSRKNRRTKEN
jgi:hypothetical protein